MKIFVGLLAFLVAPALTISDRFAHPPKDDLLENIFRGYVAEYASSADPAVVNEIVRRMQDKINLQQNPEIESKPAQADPEPVVTNSTLLGDVCVIESVDFPGEYLRILQGYWYIYAQMRGGNPIKRDGMWDWPAIWKIKKHLFQNETLYTFQNNHCSSYLTYNSDRYSFVTGMKTTNILEKAWIVSEREGANGSLVSAIRDSKLPNGYLHVVSKKDTMNKEREIRVSTAVPDEEMYQWNIVCHNGKKAE